MADPPGRLQDLLAKAQQLSDMNRALHQHIGVPLQSHCQIADMTSDTVVLHADSPAWSSRLRYRVPDVLEFLQQYPWLQDAPRVQIRVRPPDRDIPSKAEKRLTLSAAASELIQSAAYATSDGDLREALLRLSRHRP